MADVVGARCPLANEAAVRVALTLFENAPPLSDAHVDRTRGPCTSRWPRQVRGDGSMTVHEAAYSAFTAYWGVAPQRPSREVSLGPEVMDAACLTEPQAEHMVRVVATILIDKRPALKGRYQRQLGSLPLPVLGAPDALVKWDCTWADSGRKQDALAVVHAVHNNPPSPRELIRVWANNVVSCSMWGQRVIRLALCGEASTAFYTRKTTRRRDHKRGAARARAPLLTAGTPAPNRRLWGLEARRALRTRGFRGTSPTRAMPDPGERPRRVDERAAPVQSC